MIITLTLIQAVEGFILARSADDMSFSTLSACEYITLTCANGRQTCNAPSHHPR